MKTVILPGYSLKNKYWAESVQKDLNKQFPTFVHNWRHWSVGKSEKGWIEKEAMRVVKEIGNEKVNFLAKSIGTAVAMVLLKTNPQLVDKLILCGIPVNDFLGGDINYYNALKDIPSSRLLCIQNKNDNHGSLEQVKKLMGSINHDIKIISKNRNDHEYPYSKDFKIFLS